MTLIESILLGLLQGLTEFLPVSSSGHLVLGSALFGITSEDLVFEVAVHFATFLAVFVFFFNEIIKILHAPLKVLGSGGKSKEDFERTRYFLYIIIGTIPAVIVGLFLKDQIENAFSSTFLVGIMLLVTSVILFLTIFARPLRDKLKIPDSVLIGCAQAFAILPGISRSGATISTGMFLGIDKKTAFNFSFLLSLPAILGAFLLELKDAVSIGLSGELMVIYLVGMIAAFISGYICLIILRKIVIAGKFAYFGIYTLIIGVLTLIFSHG